MQYHLQQHHNLQLYRKMQHLLHQHLLLFFDGPANVILKAFFNLLDGYDKRIFKKSKDLFVIDVDGKVRYDKKAALRLFRFSGPRPLNVMRRLAAKATKLIADFLELRNAATDNRQSEKLSEMLSGKSNSGLSASDM